MNAKGQQIHTVHMLDCPVCALPAEIVGQLVNGHGARRVKQVKVICVLQHEVSLPAEDLSLPVALQSRARRVLLRLSEFWHEMEYANRRMMEIHLAVPEHYTRACQPLAPTSSSRARDG